MIINLLEILNNKSSEREEIKFITLINNVVTDGQVEFYNNGTLRINKIGKEYSDKYTLEIIQESGATSNHILQLSIEGK